MTIANPNPDLEGGGPADPAAAASSYGGVAIALHWIIALCILGQIALGWRLHDVAAGPGRYAAFQLHKSIGLSILLLSLARLAWRLVHPAPPGNPLPRWQHSASRVVHWGLYAIMIGLPLTGWIMVSTSKLPVPTRLFGIVPWPAVPGLSTLAPASKTAWNDLGHGGHALLVYVTIAMLVLHLGAVLKHQLVDRDRVFARMAPGAGPGWREPRFWIILALALAASLVGHNIVASSDAGQSGDGHAAVQRVLPPIASETPPPATTTPIVAPAPAKAEAGPPHWRVQDGQLRFATTWGGAAVSGSFSRWTADIVFAPDALERSSLVVRVDIASVSTGDSQRDTALPTSDWFDTTAHPFATFRSTRIRAVGGPAYVAVGTLDLRGVRRSIAVPFTVRIKRDTAVAQGAFTVDRTLFGVGQGEWSATDQIPAGVGVTFAIAARASAAE